MKKLLLTNLTLFITLLTFGQAITNINFQDWENRNHPTEYPSGWTIAGIGEYTNDLVSKIENDAQNADNSIKLLTAKTYDDLFPGFLFYGDMGIDMNKGEIFFQGIPFNKTADKLHFYYKSHIEENDMGFILIQILKTDGTLEDVNYTINESKSDWTKAEFAFNNNLDEIKEVFLAFLSSNIKCGVVHLKLGLG